MSAVAAVQSHQKPAVPLRSWLSVLGGVLGAFMAVLNIQVGASLADYPRCARCLDRRRFMDIDVVPDRRNHRHSADRLAFAGLQHQALHPRQRLFLRRLHDRRRICLEPGIDDRAAGTRWLLWRSAHSGRLHHHPDEAAAGKTDDRLCPLRVDGDAGLRSARRADGSPTIMAGSTSSISRSFPARSCSYCSSAGSMTNRQGSIC